MPEPIRLAILASGSGSNAVSILKHFQASTDVDVAFLGCNRPPDKAGIYDRTKSFGMETEYFSNEDLTEGRLLNSLHERGIHWVALAVFGPNSRDSFALEGRMLNIHPSLLPKFGGRGMYGMNVHRL